MKWQKSQREVFTPHGNVLRESQEEGGVQMNEEFSEQVVCPVTGSPQPSNEAVGLAESWTQLPTGEGVYPSS